jgi:gluconate 5-dehydrogenase
LDIKTMFDISGKVALVTGGGRGIGKVMAEVYGEAGAKVVICGRRAEWLNPTLEEFRAKGIDCISVIADLTDLEDVQRLVEASLQKYGQIDILVNNAGQTWGATTEDYPLEKWMQVMDVNINSIFTLSQLVGRHMIERGQGGRIINITSVMGMLTLDPAVQSMIAYNTSKGALITFTKALAREWGTKGILVNAIAPGWFRTRMASRAIDANEELFSKMAALGHIGDLEDLKGAALFLAAPASQYITGQIIAVDGGTSI